ncbi:S1 family peptidase [Streptomyces sp. 35G-GA-8]|uniref:S1 family peptidase n=1 Tax=Streptomyces sp. 35G-GA-8 TaxID=2939434 RepID=UPI0024C38C29|nr:S1 family peptidase [Streptomyces sp. 35G-GA-8]
MPRPNRSTLAALAAGMLAIPLAVSAPANAVSGAQAADGAYAFTAKLDIGDSHRACSGVLVESRWVLTAASCFAADPNVSLDIPAGAPASATKATIGRTDLTGTAGAVRDIVELVPHPDRDLVLARLSASVGNTPARLAATPAAADEQLTVAGYGRTADTWVPDKLHTGTFTVNAVNAGQVTTTGNDGAAVCQGDTGGPALRDTANGVELVALSSRSWQAGCLGTDESVTDTGAISTRLDDVTDWIGTHVARWTLKAHVNDNYVTPEINETGNQQGKLRARATTPYGWEQYTLHTRDGGQTVSLRAEANNLWVTTENSMTGDYEGMLRARGTATPAGWEQYTLVPQGGQNYALKAKVNGKFVAVEHNYTGSDADLLRARSTTVTGGWERFTFQHADNFTVTGKAPAAPTPRPLD